MLESLARACFIRLSASTRIGLFALSSSVMSSGKFLMDDPSIAISPSVYPQARRDENVVDDYHGTKVTDPYRWLEDPDAQETMHFVDKLNAVSEPFLNDCAFRDKIRQRLTELMDYEKYGCTARHGHSYFYYYNTGLQNQSVLYKQNSLSEQGRVFLDPNLFAEDGTTSIRGSAWTEDGKIFAYGLSEKGSDWATLKFRSADSGQDLPDSVCGVKHSSLSWTIDNGGVFYSRYPDHKGAIEGSSTEKHEYHSLYFHKMGTDQSEDVLCVEFRDHPDYLISGTVSEDRQYLIVDVSRGCDPYNMLFYYDLKAVDNRITGKLPIRPLFDKFDAKYEFVDSDGESMLILTNRDAPMFRLVRVKVGEDSDREERWETLIAENERHKLDWVKPIANDKLIVSYLEDVKNTLYVHSAVDGKRLYQIELDIGTVSGISGRKSEMEGFFSFESFFVPTIVYQFDFSQPDSDKSLQLKELRRVPAKGVDVSKLSAEQVFYTSRDGTKVPMYILQPTDIQLDGNNPVMLNGYGGFNVADMPYFSASRLLLLQHFRVIICTTNLRGGSEYGEKWHEGGMRERKQNVFDDFIAAAEYLIAKKYTNPNRLAIHGGSNGGLLVAACSQQRPDLYAAVFNRVGVLDMYRYHKFTIGGAWVPEFGNPDVAEDFAFISKYSPLHNIKRPPTGIQWPATLLMTADHDDRVVPLHTLKYVAQLYHMLAKEAVNDQRRPVLVRVEVKAGHGAGKPTTKVIAELVDMYSFLQRVLDLKWSD